jgi:putative membrane protein
MMPHWFGWGGFGGFGMLFGGLLMLLFWGVVIALVVLVIRALVRSGQSGAGAPPAGDRALDILRERYARGEIDKAQYEQMRDALKR